MKSEVKGAGPLVYSDSAVICWGPLYPMLFTLNLLLCMTTLQGLMFSLHSQEWKLELREVK